MDSSPPDKDRLRHFFGFTGTGTDSTPSGTDRQLRPTGQPNLRTLQSRQQNLQGHWRDWQNDVVLGAFGDHISADDRSEDETFLGGDFSLSDLLRSLPSDRLETDSCSLSDLPPLAAACMVNDADLDSVRGARARKVSELLASGADPRECDPVFGRSLLHWACIHADISVVRVIVEALRSRATLSALPMMSEHQSMASIAKDIDQPDVNGLTPLQAVLTLRRASAAEHAEIVQCLLQHGASLFTLPLRGAELLWADFLTIDIARTVLATGISVNVRDAIDSTPLLKSALAGNAPLVKFLLQQGADPRQRIFFGGGILNHYGMSVEVAALLLDYGADANHRDDLGMTPLMFACQDKNLPLVRLLLKHGASVRARSVDNMRVIDYAPDEETVRYLKTEAGLAPGTRLADD